MFSAPVPRLRQQMAAADSGLSTWVKHHPYLVASDVGQGESGMALLLLWEVDHQQAYPSVGGEGLSGALMGFSKRLQERVMRDPELQWLEWKDMSAPLSAGLAPSYHRRWSVRVVAPAEGEPRGWYEEFVSRWRAYLEVVAQPRGVRLMASVTEMQVARVRPKCCGLEVGQEAQQSSLVVVSSGLVAAQGTLEEGVMVEGLGGPTVEEVPPAEGLSAIGVSRPVARRARPAVEAGGAETSLAKRQKVGAVTQAGATIPPKRKRAEGEALTVPPRQRQRSLTGWVKQMQSPTVDAPEEPETSRAPRHGRAVQGPPT